MINPFTPMPGGNLLLIWTIKGSEYVLSKCFGRFVQNTWDLIEYLAVNCN